MIRDEPARARKILLDALREEGGNVSNACERLGMGRRTFYKYIHALKIEGLPDVVRAQKKKTQR